MMTSKITQILTLARAGNPVRAWSLFQERGLGEGADDPKVLTLKGRLLKDLADRAAGDERTRLYREASAAYLAAYDLKTDSYPLINAATLALLAGDAQEAHKHAETVLNLIESDPSEGETAYWHEATRSEALLLFGQRDDAEKALAKGIAKLPQAWEDHAATIGQFERIVSAQSGDHSWLDAFRPACSVHFSGMIGLDPSNADLATAIETTIADLKPGFAFGALAAGADIMLAEGLLDAGAELHVTLPCPVDEFRAISVEPFGGDWGTRFDALLGRAETLRELPSQESEASVASTQFELASLVSMGQAKRHAETVRSSAHAITIAASGEPMRSALQQWQKSAAPIITIETQRVSGPRSSKGSKAQDVAHQLNARATVSGAEPESLAKLAKMHGLKLSHSGAKATISGDPQTVLQAVNSAISDTPEARAAIQLSSSAMAEDAPDSASELFSASTKGSLVSDWASAMAYKAIQSDLRIEELGEVRLAGGRTELWSIGSATPAA